MASALAKCIRDSQIANRNKKHSDLTVPGMVVYISNQRTAQAYVEIARTGENRPQKMAYSPYFTHCIGASENTGYFSQTISNQGRWTRIASENTGYFPAAAH